MLGKIWKQICLTTLTFWMTRLGMRSLIKKYLYELINVMEKTRKGLKKLKRQMKYEKANSKNMYSIGTILVL